MQCYTNGDASYKDITLWADVIIWSSYDAATHWILIWNLNSWEDLNSHYNALMHSTETCLCLGLPNILLSSLSNSSFYSFLPHLSVLQCHHLIKANHWIKLTNERPTWCHLLFYFTYYVLNMFRTLIYPSSGACDCVDELSHRSSCSVKTDDLALV